MRKYLKGDATNLVGPPLPTRLPEVNFLLSSIRLANRAIFEMAQSEQQYAGMGTTLVAALALLDRLVLAHVGYSRIYRMYGERITQLSKDHSLVQQQVDRGIISPEEAQTSQYKHLITRALGLKSCTDDKHAGSTAREQQADKSAILSGSGYNNSKFHGAEASSSRCVRVDGFRGLPGYPSYCT